VTGDNNGDANGHRTPVIFVTALSDEKIRERVLEAKAFGFFGAVQHLRIALPRFVLRGGYQRILV
jgi:hypothetical protein